MNRKCNEHNNTIAIAPTPIRRAIPILPAPQGFHADSSSERELVLAKKRVHGSGDDVVEKDEKRVRVRCCDSGENDNGIEKEKGHSADAVTSPSVQGDQNLPLARENNENKENASMPRECIPRPRYENEPRRKMETHMNLVGRHADVTAKYFLPRIFRLKVRPKMSSWRFGRYRERGR